MCARDRTILQRLITAYEAGRKVHRQDILQHELPSPPLSLANPDGTLQTGKKAELCKYLAENIEHPSHLDPDQDSHLIIDGQALVMSIGNPSKARIF